MLYLVKNLKANVDLYAGFREIDFFIDEFKSYINDVYISTNSGKVGQPQLHKHARGDGPNAYNDAPAYSDRKSVV